MVDLCLKTKQYGMNTDQSGEFSAMYKPFHLIGMELNTSIFSAALLKLPTGQTKYFKGDVVSVRWFYGMGKINTCKYISKLTSFTNRSCKRHVFKK